VHFTNRKRKDKAKYIKSIEYHCAKKINSDFISENNYFISPIKFRLYIIAHDKFSSEIANKWSECMPFASVLIIPKSHFFESIIYKEILPNLANEWENLDFVGIATYKSLKFVPLEKLKASLELAFYKPYDVVPLFSAGEFLVEQGVRGHTEEFRNVWYSTLLSVVEEENSEFLFEKLKKFDQVEVFLRNTFIASPRALKALVKFMNRSIKVVEENNPPLFIGSLLSHDAHYREKKETIARAVYDRDYYYWHPFIFERLPVFFFHYYNFSVFGSLKQAQVFSNAMVDDLFKGL
jgi:hypothetical protein